MSARKKPERAFHVAIYDDSPMGMAIGIGSERCAIYGTTFFDARARLCVAYPDVEPDHVRLDPPARMRLGAP